MLLILMLSAFLQRAPELIRILEATRQEWTGGIEESGKGVNYDIRLVVKKNSANLNFVSVTVDQQGCSYKITNVNRPAKGDRYQKGDTLLISALLKNPPVRTPQKETPYPVIGYIYKKTLYYFPIRQGIQVGQMNYP